MRRHTITPSILNANFLYLDRELRRLQEIHLSRIHYDVMDYDFVPNLTFGAKILRDIREKYSEFYIDIHFMVRIKNLTLTEFLQPFIACSPNLMTMHLETLTPRQIQEFLDLCRVHKIKSSLAIKPETSIEKLSPYLREIDNILIMTVEPGFGGQKIIPETLEKIEKLSQLKFAEKYRYTIEADGGINNQNFAKIVNRGVDDVVIGSYLFQSENLKEAYDDLQK